MFFWYKRTFCTKKHQQQQREGEKEIQQSAVVSKLLQKNK